MSSAVATKINEKVAETVFSQLADAVTSACSAHYTLTISGEASQFMRFNRARVRQTGLAAVKNGTGRSAGSST